MNINIRLQNNVTSEDSYDLEHLSTLLKKECDLTVKEEKKIESLSNVKDGGLMVGIAIVGLVLTAIEPFISVLTYWQSQNPKYSATMVIDNITYTIENISPQKIKQIQSTLAGLQSNPKKSDTINGAHQDIWIAKNKSVLQVVLISEEEAQDTSQAEILADFRQAWHEAMTGQTIPVSQLWDGLEND